MGLVGSACQLANMCHGPHPQLGVFSWMAVFTSAFDVSDVFQMICVGFGRVAMLRVFLAAHVVRPLVGDPFRFSLNPVFEGLYIIRPLTY
jgi:hypothetical protein